MESPTPIDVQYRSQGKNAQRRRPEPSSVYPPRASPPSRRYAIIVHAANETDNDTDSSSTVRTHTAPATLEYTLVNIETLSQHRHPSSPIPHAQVPDASNGELATFMYGAVDLTEIHVREADAGNLDSSDTLLKCCAFSNNGRTVLASRDHTDCNEFDQHGGIQTTPECINFLQLVISAWQSKRRTTNKERNCVLPRKDIERVCKLLAPQDIMGSQHSHCHYCTCAHDRCIADAIISAFGIDVDFNYSRESITMSGGPNTTALKSAQEHNGKSSQNTLRLIVARRCMIQDQTPGKCNTLEGNSSNETTPRPSFRSNSGTDLVLPLSSTKVPLISISLLPIHKETNNATTASSSSSSVVSTDALLRACVKRLLVGRVLLHSRVLMRSQVKEHGSSFDETLAFRTCLSVQVPQNPSSCDKSEYHLLEFQVMDVQSTCRASSHEGVSDALQLPALFVILPSTRILFQTCNEKDQSLPTNPNQQKSSLVPSPITALPASALSHHSTNAPMPPHQHLVESLRSIVFFQPDQGQLPIPRSFLFTGPPGVGKTFSVKSAIAIANSWSYNPTTKTGKDATVRLISIRGSELLASAYSGGNYATAARELEKQFDMAVGLYRGNPADDGVKAVVVFLDECDALVSSNVVAAALAVILDRMEGILDLHKDNNGWERVIVVAATNRIDAIPAFLRRPGRLEKEVVVSPPNGDERFLLLKGMLVSSGSMHAHKNISVVNIDEVGLHKVAEACVGYVAADLSALARRAAIISIEESFRQESFTSQLSLLGHHMIATKYLFEAMKDVGASCLRDASLSAPPKTIWDDIAGDAGGAKRALREAIEWPRTRRSAFEALGLSPPRGVLLHGPPGCAKTTLARAAAGAAGVAFLSLSPADVYASSYVGEAEAVCRRAFDLARSAAPCVLFFDEIDAILGGGDDAKQGLGMGRGTSAEARVLSTFLNEMDGVDGSIEDGVLVLGATNRPGTLDAALLRPGRFDRIIYVPPPDELGRKAILTMECTKWYDALLSFSPSSKAINTSSGINLSPDGAQDYFDVDMLAKEAVCGSMTGAEIVGTCREIAVQVMQQLMESQSKFDGKSSSKMAESHLQSLMETLESSLRRKTPLLSDSKVLEEYTRFENERG